MKVYEKVDVDQAFESVIKLIDDGADLQSLRTFCGSLAMTVTSRLEQIRNGTAKSAEREFEIAKLEAASSLLRFKLNSSTAEDITRDKTEAYKAYALH
ncbi:hypothetical protein [Marinimicrobium agarilyticum]|uniref:hypothetical protein n=1 Tax=Marinimicrobium agarilyticum TaxID=306546 RepID=UPI0004018296|nr:hypothetical protein [Marinimicrobium agarilyticum]